MELKQQRGEQDQHQAVGLMNYSNSSRRHQALGDSPAIATTSTSWQQQVHQQPQNPGTLQATRARNQQQPRQQQSGETASSFESDYDFLVGCLNEQEDTEDIVETEQSLDYQDQTWRQSICGGASLAPTIDGSFSELLGAGSRNHLEQDFDLLMTPTPYNNSGFNLSNQNTNNSNNYLTASRNSYAPPTATASQLANPINRNSQVTPANNPSNLNITRLARSPLANRNSNIEQQQQHQQQPEEDECDREVISVLHEKLPEKQQRQQVNLGNKLVSLFKSPSSSSRQLEEASKREKSHTLSGPKLTSVTIATPAPNHGDQMRVASSSSNAKYKTMATTGGGGGGGSTGDASELDRLLAEMSQALDLDSLAKFDSRPTNSGNINPRTNYLNQRTLLNYNNPSQQQQLNTNQYQLHHQQVASGNQNGSNINRANKSATLAGGLLQSSRLYSNQQQQQVVPPNTRTGSTNDLGNTTSAQQQQQQQQQQLQHGFNINYQPSPQPLQQINASSHSNILDEYDGASRILEQMISDQLRDGSSNSIMEFEPQPQVAASGGGGRELSTSNSLTRPINKSTATSNQSYKDDASLSSRKMSTCSSSQATEASVILATTKLPPGGTPNSRKLTATPPLMPTGRGGSSATSHPVSKSISSRSIGNLPAPQRSLDLASETKEPMNERLKFTKPTLSLEKFQNNASATRPPPPQHQNKSTGGRFLRRLSASQRKSLEESPPPPPPAVDYDVDISKPKLGASDITFPLDDREPIEKVIQVSPACDSDDSDSEIEAKITSAALQIRGQEPSVSGNIGGNQRKRSFPQVNRMRKSMRNMRDKFNNLISSPAEPQNNDQNVRSQRQRSKLEISAPITLTSFHQPTSKRSSSVSDDEPTATTGRQAAIEKPTVDSKQPSSVPSTQRQSRSLRRRKDDVNHETNDDRKIYGNQQQQSFGQQIRERLSRSKSRFSKFLKPNTKRAQSQPSKAPRIPVGGEEDDRRLFQPGDIARNLPIDTRDITLRSTSAMGAEAHRSDSSFDRSLDRHLAAKMASRRKSSSSSSSSSSLVSGLETNSKGAGSSERVSRRSASMRRLSGKDSPASQKKRSSSLLSIKKLRSWGQTRNPTETEDLDEIKVRVGKEERQKVKRGVKSAAPLISSTDKLDHQDRGRQMKQVVLEKTTDDYFGQVAPVEDLDLSNCQPGKVCIVQAPQSRSSALANKNVQTPSTQKNNLDELDKPKRPTRNSPSRSHSMRQTSSTLHATPPASSDPNVKDVEQKASSTSNLSTFAGSSRRIELPEPTNTFRPTSVLGDVEDGKLKIKNGQKISDTKSTEPSPTREQVVTPIGPRRETSSTNLSETNLNVPKQTAKRSISPLRSKGSTILGDIKSKCSEFFSHSSQNENSKLRLSNERQQLAEQKPQRPPRSRGRAKSMGPPMVVVDLPSEVNLQAISQSNDGLHEIDLNSEHRNQQQQQVVLSVEPASPTDSSLDPSINNLDLNGNGNGNETAPGQRPTTPVALAGRKLANFAQQLKLSATDFFNNQDKSSTQNGRGRSKSREEEKDLVHWSPVIKTQRKSQPLIPISLTTKQVSTSKEQTSPKSLMTLDATKMETSNQNQKQLQVGKAHEEPRNVKLETLRQAERSLDLTNDSTWESATDDEESEADRVEDEMQRGDDGKSIVQLGQQVAVEASVAADESRLSMPASNLKRQQEYDSDKAAVAATTTAAAAAATEHIGTVGATNRMVAEGKEQLELREQKRQQQQTQNIVPATSGGFSASHSIRRAQEPETKLVASNTSRSRQQQVDKAGEPSANEPKQRHQIFDSRAAEGTRQIDELGDPISSLSKASNSAGEIATESQVSDRRIQAQVESEAKGKVANRQEVSGGIVCETQFKFNDNLPSPSQIFNLNDNNNSNSNSRDKIGKNLSSTNEMKYESLDVACEQEEQRKSQPPGAEIMGSEDDRSKSRKIVDATQNTYNKNTEEMQLIGDTRDGEQQEGVATADNATAAASAANLSEDLSDTISNRLSIYENVEQQPKQVAQMQQINKQQQEQTQPQKTPETQSSKISRQQVSSEEPQRLMEDEQSKAESTRRPINSPTRQRSESQVSQNASDWNIDLNADIDESRVAMNQWKASPSVKEKLKRFDEQLAAVEREVEIEELERELHQRISKEKSEPTRPKLIAMTSLIQDPNDELMMVSAKSNHQLSDPPTPTTATGGGSGERSISQLANRRDSTFSYDNNNNSDTDDSSFAAATENRKRLINRFNQQRSSPKPRLPPRPSNSASQSRFARMLDSAAVGKTGDFGGENDDHDRASRLPPQPARPSGGSSLVKRLARNFDQTAVEQQQQAAASRRPPIAPRSATTGSGKQVVKTQVLPTSILADSFASERQASQQEDEPKSESTWYDAESVELLDVAEVAELLREFESENQTTTTGMATATTAPTAAEGSRLPLTTEPQEESESATSCSISTGVDSYVTVAESTLRSERQNAGENQRQVDENDRNVNDDGDDFDDDDDDDNGSSDSDDAMMSDDNDDDTLNDEVGLMSNMEDDRTESYISAAAAAPSLSSSSSNDNVASEQPQPQHQHQQQQSQQANSATEITSPRSSNIDNQFKNSLNDIIARRSAATSSTASSNSLSRGLSQSEQSDGITMTAATTIDLRDKTKEGFKQQQVPTTGDQINDDNSENEAKTPTQKQQQTNAQKCKQQLKGLTSYYKALIRRHKKHNQNSKQQQHQTGSQVASGQLEGGESKQVNSLAKETSGNVCPNHSSSASSSSSTVSSLCPSEAEESDDDEEISTASSATNARLVEATDSRNLVRAAKRCSRLYDELEKILATRAVEQQSKLQVLREETSTGGGQQLDLATGAENDPQDQPNRRPVSSELSEEVDDFFFEESLSLSLTDQTSLSSSSLSSESIPEIKLRQNLQKLYHIVNEIYTSEKKFVDTLKLLNVDFRLHMTQAPCDFPLDCVNSLLKHLPHLQALNENLMDELKLARDQWPTSQKIAHVLVKIGPFLKHYSTYIREFELMQQQFQENLRKHSSFAERVKKFEADEKSQNLTIQHHLLKPIQRIPQYRLLLQQYLHHLKPDDVDYEDTVNALEVVSRVAEHANQSMNDGVNFAKLLALQAKIVGKRHDIVQPGRLLIKEGELMKVCRKQIQPRWFVLLSDALLYLTQIQSSDILYLNNELPLDDCLISTPDEITSLDHLSDPSAPRPKSHQQPQLMGKHFDREFTVSTRTKSFALVAKTRVDRDEWVSMLRKTVEELNAKRRSFLASSSNSTNRLATAAATTTTTNSLTSDTQQQHLQQQQQPNKPHTTQLALQIKQQQQQVELLGQRAPLWTPDSRVTMCQLCTRGFSALFRRHHCRACGRVVCSACSSNKAPLMYLKCRAARVCDECFDELRASIHLYYLPYTLNQQVGATEEELRRLDEHFRTLLKSQFKRHSGAGGKAMKLGHLNSLLNQINHIMG